MTTRDQDGDAGLREPSAPWNAEEASWRSPRWVLAVVGGGVVAVTITDALGFSPSNPVALLIAMTGMLGATALFCSPERNRRDDQLVHLCLSCAQPRRSRSAQHYVQALLNLGNINFAGYARLGGGPFSVANPPNPIARPGMPPGPAGRTSNDIADEVRRHWGWR